MCFNAPVSLTTFTIGSLGSLLLWREGYRPESLFYFWVIQMQLIEFIIWTQIPDNDREISATSESSYTCTPTNAIATILGNVINHTEPIILWLGIYMFSTPPPISLGNSTKKSHGSKRLPPWVHILSLIYTLTALLYTTSKFLDFQCTFITPHSSPHLHWAWNETKDYTSTFFYALFLGELVVLSVYGLGNRGRVHSAVLVGTFAMSWWVYYDTHAVGAMWCFAAAFAPWVLVGWYRVRCRSN